MVTLPVKPLERQLMVSVLPWPIRSPPPGVRIEMYWVGLSAAWAVSPYAPMLIYPPLGCGYCE